jgi:hypothetical protein
VVLVAGAAAVTRTTPGAAACAAAVASVVLVAIAMAVAVAVVVPGVVRTAWLDVKPGVFLGCWILVVGVWADTGERADCQYHRDEHTGGECREAHQDLMHDSLISLLVDPDCLGLAALAWLAASQAG